MELGIARRANGARCRVALDDIDFASAFVFRSAVDELLHAVGHIGFLLQIGFDALARFLGVFTRALVDEHLLDDFAGGFLILDEICGEAFLEKRRHGLLNEAVVDGLLRLILVGRLRREAVGHKHEAVLHVLPFDGGLVFGVFVLRLDVCVKSAGQSAARSFFGRAAIFEPRRIVIVLLHLEGAREAQTRGDFDVVIGQVVAVAATTVGLDEEYLVA